MKNNILPPTVNIHSIAPCNYRCGFCYAGFASAKRSRIPADELREIILQIAQARPDNPAQPRKVTFAGGEPLLDATLVDSVSLAKSLGLVTSVVTNASLLSKTKIIEFAPVLHWLTFSIDSLNVETNRRIGRGARGVPLTEAEYLSRICLAQEMGIRVKINTVVNRENIGEDFSVFIRRARPLRWKLFQVTRIAEENGEKFDQWGVTEDAFHEFTLRHAGLSDAGIVIVPETQDEIYGSYAMVGPNGCFFDNSSGAYRYSRPIISVGIEAAFSDIQFSIERFRHRQGDYDFQTGLNWREVAR